MEEEKNKEELQYLIGVDVGGTNTDSTLIELNTN